MCGGWLPKRPKRPARPLNKMRPCAPCARNRAREFGRGRVRARFHEFAHVGARAAPSADAGPAPQRRNNGALPQICDGARDLLRRRPRRAGTDYFFSCFLLISCFVFVVLFARVFCFSVCLCVSVFFLCVFCVVSPFFVCVFFFVLLLCRRWRLAAWPSGTVHAASSRGLGPILKTTLTPRNDATNTWPLRNDDCAPREARTPNLEVNSLTL